MLEACCSKNWVKNIEKNAKSKIHVLADVVTEKAQQTSKAGRNEGYKITLCGRLSIQMPENRFFS
jgi:hypothetical protein